MVEFAQLREMHYLQAAVHESMRLFPPVQFDSKFCEENDVLADGTFVTRGTRVTYHPYAMGRMERIWGPDCLEFKPERWLRVGFLSKRIRLSIRCFKRVVGFVWARKWL
ncbi:UNVERIFIED_CONTAM: cytochrome [Sesamum angustifolium]|uniref:Cytochrome n=1 Tax=Sesamum angustifolium TaxID=2727405 RepID=A0AAW2QPQ2_9LAMI